MLATEICLINADFAAAYADQWASTRGTERLIDVSTFCLHTASSHVSRHDISRELSRLASSIHLRIEEYASLVPPGV